jgi:hypothetical protein
MQRTGAQRSSETDPHDRTLYQHNIHRQYVATHTRSSFALLLRVIDMTWSSVLSTCWNSSLKGFKSPCKACAVDQVVHCTLETLVRNYRLSFLQQSAAERALRPLPMQLHFFITVRWSYPLFKLHPAAKQHIASAPHTQACSNYLCYIRARARPEHSYSADIMHQDVASYPPHLMHRHMTCYQQLHEVHGDVDIVDRIQSICVSRRAVMSLCCMHASGIREMCIDDRSVEHQEQVTQAARRFFVRCSELRCVQRSQHCSSVAELACWFNSSQL